MKTLKLFAITIPLCIPLVLWGGYVLSTLWGWFVVPLGVPDIGVAHAIGLAACVKMFRGIPGKGEVDEAYLVSATASGMIGPGVALLVGWLAVRWMS